MTVMLQVPRPAKSETEKPALVQSRAGGPQLIAIASGKGGVGKTWLAISLAQCLATRGLKVLLFDGDLGLANVDIQLGLTPKQDLSSVLSGRVALAQVIIRHEVSEQPAAAFDIVPGRSGAASIAALELGLLDQLIGSVRLLRGYDIVLLDLGAGIDPVTRFMAAAADTLIVVSTDEPTALTDAYAVMKLHARDQTARRTRPVAGGTLAKPDVRLVINQATSLASGRRTYDVLARACTTFLGEAPLLAGVIRRDGRVADAIRRQTTLLTRYPNTPAAEDVARIANAFVN